MIEITLLQIIHQPQRCRLVHSRLPQASSFYALRWFNYFTLVCVVSVLTLTSAFYVSGQQRRRGAAPRSTPEEPAAAQNQTVPGKTFEQISSEASTARDTDKLTDAIVLYRQGLSMRP